MTLRNACLSQRRKREQSSPCHSDLRCLHAYSSERISGPDALVLAGLVADMNKALMLFIVLAILATAAGWYIGLRLALLG